MEIELTYKELAEIIKGYYESNNQGEVIAKCYNDIHQVPDGWGFYDDINCAEAYIQITKKIEVFGQVKEINEKIYLEPQEILKLLSKSLKDSNLKVISLISKKRGIILKVEEINKEIDEQEKKLVKKGE